MTPDEIRQARVTLGLTPEQMGRMLRYGAAGNVRVSELETGKRNAGAAVVALLRAYLEGYRPKDWPG